MENSNEIRLSVNNHVHYRMVLKTEAELDSIERLIQEHVPEAKKARLFGKELSYILPRENVPE